MLLNYFKIAFRNFLRHKGTTAINITTMALGITCCILIFIWIQDELNFDSFHQNEDKIFRIVQNEKVSSTNQPDAMSPVPLAPTLKNELIEVEKSTRVRTISNWAWSITAAQKTFIEPGICFVDEDFFTMFTFPPLISGNYTDLFSNLNSIILTDEMSQKYFGSLNIVGKTMTLDNRQEVTIVGVINKPPKNSHIQYDFLLSFNLYEKFGRSLNNWKDQSYYTYIQVSGNPDQSTLNQKINDCIKNHYDEISAIYEIQPLRKVHLYSSHLAWDVAGQGDITYVYIFAILGYLILSVACINFANLSTAQADFRLKEIGVRKFIGAKQSSIFVQFLIESLLSSFISLIVVLFLIEFSLPQFNFITGKEFTFDAILTSSTIGVLIIAALVAGIMAGIYPALIMSAYTPKRMLSASKSSKPKTGLRKLLVTAQLVITIILITGTLAIYNQAIFIENKKLGFQKENIVYVEISRDMLDKIDILINELSMNPNIIDVAGSANLITNGRAGGYDGFEWEGKPESQKLHINIEAVTHNLINTLEMEIVKGRNFSGLYSSDSSNVILNEAAVKAMQLDSPIGTKVKWFREGRVIGVVKDYNYQSLHKKVEPLLLFCNPRWVSYLYCKIVPKNYSETLAAIEKIFDKHFPFNQNECKFLNAQYEILYKSEKQIQRFITAASLISIFISCLGLLGLIFYSANQRKREIGIRKVLGASAPNIIYLITKEYLVITILANLLAWPIAYLIIKKWLENFAYKIHVGVYIFLAASLLTILIIILTTSLQALRASQSNPAEILKCE